MTSRETPKIKRYYGLRLVSLFYKMLAVMLILLIIGANGYIGVAAINSPAGDWIDFQNWWPQAVGLTVGGGLLALTFFVFSQIIDVTIANSDHLRKLVSQHDETLTAMKTATRLMESHTEKLTTTASQQARLLRLQQSEAKEQSNS